MLFHTLNTVNPPFSLENNPGEGTCCNSVVLPILHWTQPPNLNCTVTWLLRSGQQDCQSGAGQVLGGGQGSNSNGTVGVTVPLDCGSITPIPSNAF